jgi:hypothetical protein
MKTFIVKITVDGQHRHNKLPISVKESIEATFIDEGGEGVYCSITDEVGLKIFYSKGHKKAAKRQYNKMKQLEHTGIVPKAYALCSVTFISDGMVCPGILMEHIKGVTLFEKEGYDERGEYFDHIRKAIKPFYHSDLHSKNVLVTDTGKIYAIDV